ncbi:cation:proton antiporter [Streptomyces sp. CSDS2]|uniref:cation:proton antiporter n=1 Tax=Streptomyces sp. CSDS2 TaxID=3055051 RepID=UPI0025AF48D4|nr:cation:proton antiporter [Streptomyces sp. CSDS2]MDN3261576.1 cation:proton antiporter [Streptomyces sp. CSDS2]
MSTTEMGPAFFLAVVVILTACRLVSRLLRPLGQPPVVGEMVAGVALGPSVLGLLSPGLEKAVFPDEIRPVLYVAGQVGLVVFMFLSGYEFRTDRLRSVGRTAVPVSAAGIVVPLLLGTGLAWAAHDAVDLYPDGISPSVGALFVGVTVAITAFPMMARIITERGLTKTRFGAVSLAAGALDDAVAWVLLAGVLSMAGSGAETFLRAVIGTAGLAVFLGIFLRVRPSALERARRLTGEQMLLVTVLLLFLAAWYTDRIGLYAVFGAFSLGVAFPRDPVVTRAVEAVAPVSRIVFLPLFFAYSGLNTDFTLLSDGGLLLFTVVCVAVAIISKFGACWATARLLGEPQAVAVRVGTLMNARGLMQLIAINVGLSAGIASPALFGVLVIVALVTTVMTAPLLALLDHRDRRRRPGEAPMAEVTPATREP